jgi:hypothetical protein
MLGEKPGERTHLGKGQLNPPDLTLVTETVLSGELLGETKNVS